MGLGKGDSELERARMGGRVVGWRARCRSWETEGPTSFKINYKSL